MASSLIPLSYDDEKYLLMEEEEEEEEVDNGDGFVLLEEGEESMEEDFGMSDTFAIGVCMSTPWLAFIGKFIVSIKVYG